MFSMLMMISAKMICIRHITIGAWIAGIVRSARSLLAVNWCGNMLRSIREDAVPRERGKASGFAKREKWMIRSDLTNDNYDRNDKNNY